VHSPRTRDIIQHFQREVRLQVEGLNDDLHTTNECLGQLETTQIETSATLMEMKTAQTMTNDTLTNIMRQLAAISK
jgi:hypothetical protein